ncbi:MAG TPA: glyoxalase/bleomycin resistance/extradiol dioxygenase family protein [Exiguobacterium sp.]|nr:glyoxalase/bleomycin resistance/extradiol dioxygenase family protein [Exiguobacterium sp.]
MKMKIEHIALWVADLEGMRQFYETHFDATTGERYHNPMKGFTSYFLTFSSGARLELMQRTDITERTMNALGYAHLAFSLGSKQAVDDWTARLQDEGIQHLDGPRTTGDGYYESTIADPEGNVIELTV